MMRSAATQSARPSRDEPAGQLPGAGPAERWPGVAAVVDREQLGEELRTRGQSAQHAAPDRRPRLGEQQKADEEIRPSGQPTHSSRVAPQAVVGEAVGQRQRLPEGESQPFAGDGVAVACRVANERHGPRHTLRTRWSKPAAPRSCDVFGASPSRATSSGSAPAVCRSPPSRRSRAWRLQPPRQRRPRRRPRSSRPSRPRHRRSTAAPGSGGARRSGECGPRGRRGGSSAGFGSAGRRLPRATDRAARRRRSRCRPRRPVDRQAAHRRAPGEVDARLPGPIDQGRMQPVTAHREAANAGKVGSHRHAVAGVADAAEGPARPGRKRDADLGEGAHAVRHQALAARLVDRRPGALHHPHGEPAPAAGDGRGQPRRAAADDQNIGLGRAAHSVAAPERGSRDPERVAWVSAPGRGGSAPWRRAAATSRRAAERPGGRRGNGAAPPGDGSCPRRCAAGSRAPTLRRGRRRGRWR